MEDLKDNAITSIRWKPVQEGKNKVLVTADAYWDPETEEDT